jgi:hypothetical protein
VGCRGTIISEAPDGRNTQVPAAKKKLKGGAVGSVKNLRKSLKSGGSGRYLQRIKAEGTTVRFLTEPDEWFKFYEHYDDTRKDNYYFPCTEDCEGCEEGLDVSKRYLANALDVDDNRVVPLVLPASLVTNLLKKYDKFKTIKDRDYELTKDGSGFDTEYDALYEQPHKRDLKRYDLLDLGDVLLSQLSEGEDDDDDDDEDETPKRKSSKGGSKKPPKRRPSKSRDEDDDDDEDEAPRRPKKRIAKPPAKKKVMGKKNKPLSKR